MKIGLIRPPISGEKTYPLELARLYTVARQMGEEVCCYDLAIQQGAKYLNDLASMDLLYFSTSLTGIAAFEKDLPRLLDTIAKIKEKGRAKIIVGGDYCTRNPALIKKTDQIDYLLCGDVEYIFPQVLKYLKGEEKTCPEGCIFPAASVSCHWANSLDGFPHASYTGLPLDKYAGTIAGLGQQCFPIITSRGCPLSCSYCEVPFTCNKQFRPRNYNELEQEMRAICQAYRDIHFLVEDDLFNFDANHVEKFCHLVRQLPGQISWECVNGLNPEYLSVAQIRLMASAGCRHIALGIEVWDVAAAKELGRNLDKAHVLDLLQECKGLELVTSGYFILNPPASKVRKQLVSFFATLKLSFNFVHYSIYYDGRRVAWKYIFFQKMAYLIYYAKLPHLRHILRLFLKEPRLVSKKIIKKIVRVY